jgi:hypothetical protein
VLSSHSTCGIAFLQELRLLPPPPPADPAHAALQTPPPLPELGARALEQLLPNLEAFLVALADLEPSCNAARALGAALVERLPRLARALKALPANELRALLKQHYDSVQRASCGDAGHAAMQAGHAAGDRSAPPPPPEGRARERERDSERERERDRQRDYETGGRARSYGEGRDGSGSAGDREPASTSSSNSAASGGYRDRGERERGQSYSNSYSSSTSHRSPRSPRRLTSITHTHAAVILWAMDSRDGEAHMCVYRPFPFVRSRSASPRSASPSSYKNRQPSPCAPQPRDDARVPTLRGRAANHDSASSKRDGHASDRARQSDRERSPERERGRERERSLERERSAERERGRERERSAERERGRERGEGRDRARLGERPLASLPHAAHAVHSGQHPRSATHAHGRGRGGGYYSGYRSGGRGEFARPPLEDRWV